MSRPALVLSLAALAAAFAAPARAATATHVRPLALPIGFFDPSGPSRIQYNQECTLVLTNDGNENPGNAGVLQTFIEPLAFTPGNADPKDGSTGYAHYRYGINHGYDAPVRAYKDYVHTYAGQDGGYADILAATNHAFASDDGLFAQAAAFGDNGTPDHPNPNSPLILVLPVISHMVGDDDGHLVCGIYGFATFYLEGYDNGKFTGRFIRLTLMPGDVDGNGAVDTADAVLLLRRMAGLTAAGDAGEGDVSPANGDGRLGLDDAVRLLRHVQGLDDGPPWP